MPRAGPGAVRRRPSTPCRRPTTTDSRWNASEHATKIRPGNTRAIRAGHAKRLVGVARAAVADRRTALSFAVMRPACGPCDAGRARLLKQSEPSVRGRGAGLAHGLG